MVEKNDLLKIASIAKLKMTEEEAETIVKKFNVVLDTASLFNELDLEDVEPLYNINSVTNVMREDIPKESFERETMLANAPEKLYGCIKVSKIIE